MSENIEKNPPKGSIKFNINLSEEQKEAKTNILYHPYNFIMGKAGSGKTLLARCLPSILPTLSYQEALETTTIHSVMGQEISPGIGYRPPPISALSDIEWCGLLNGRSKISP